jgi:hypothetical protein
MSELSLQDLGVIWYKTKDRFHLKQKAVLHSGVHLFSSCLIFLFFVPDIHLMQIQAACLKSNYRGADKFLARPGKKKALATEDFGFHISYL